jgi:NUMOD3 motif
MNRKPHTEKTKRRISESHKGKTISQEQRDQISETLTGRVQSQETVAKRSESIRNSPKIQNRARYLALERGDKFYTPEEPCKYGHSFRDTKFMECVECKKDSNRTLNARVYAMWWSARKRAKRENLPFNLTREYIESIWPKDNRCPITKEVFESPTGAAKRGAIPSSPSLDKTTPELGYVEGNVAIISWYANKLKSSCSDSAFFRRLADWLDSRIENVGHISEDYARFMGWDLKPLRNR